MYDVSYTVVVDIGRQTGQSYQSVNHTNILKIYDLPKYDYLFRVEGLKFKV